LTADRIDILNSSQGFLWGYCDPYLSILYSVLYIIVLFFWQWYGLVFYDLRLMVIPFCIFKFLLII